MDPIPAAGPAGPRHTMRSVAVAGSPPLYPPEVPRAQPGMLELIYRHYPRRRNVSLSYLEIGAVLKGAGIDQNRVAVVGIAVFVHVAAVQYIRFLFQNKEIRPCRHDEVAPVNRGEVAPPYVLHHDLLRVGVAHVGDVGDHGIQRGSVVKDVLQSLDLQPCRIAQAGHLAVDEVLVNPWHGFGPSHRIVVSRDDYHFNMIGQFFYKIVKYGILLVNIRYA